MRDKKQILVRPSVKITLYYFVFSVIWILASDSVLSVISSDPQYITRLGIIKGWFFVTVSSVFIFILINKYFRLYVKSEEQKEAIREHYNNFIRKANDIIILTDSEWNIVEVNDKTVEAYRYSKDELTGMNMWQLRTDKGNEEFNKYLETFEGAKGRIVETEHRKKNGEIFPVESSFHFLILGEDKYIQLILRDISAIKEFEDSLLKANRLYSVLTNINKSIVRNKSKDELLNSVCNILVHKGEFKMSWIGMYNAGSKNIKEKSSCNLSSEYLNLVSSGVRHGTDGIGETLNCPLINLFEKGIKTVNNELDSVVLLCPYREKVLSLGVLSCSALPLYVFGKLYGGLMIYSGYKKAFNKDIIGLLDELASDLSFALENIETKKIKRKLEYAVENNPVSIIITDIDGKIEYVNPTFYNTMGYSSDEVIDKDIFADFNWHNNDKINEIRKEISYKGTWRGEMQSVTKYGSTIWELVSVSAGKLSDTGEQSLVFVRENISRIKKTEEELRDAKNKAEEINRLKSVFLANMNHELRTPLTGILGYASILFDELSDSKHKEMADIIIKGSKRLADTLNSILDLTGLEGKVISLNKSVIDVAELLKSYVNSFSLLADDKGLEFNFSSETDELLCCTDERLLNQIVNNLLENAFKYTDSGSIDVLLSANKMADETYIKFIVRDTGIGIPAEYIDLIFEPFRQVSEGLNRKFEGTGLGLTITKRFVELLGGKIEVNSESGNGSEFCVTIPANKKDIKESEIKDIKFVLKKESRKRNVLVVEDDIVSSRLINTMLKDFFNCVHVPDGETAIKEIQKNLYDLILMDINLRGINGLDTMSKIKLIDRYKNVPFIAVTAYAMSGDSEYLKQHGFDDYVSKPFSSQKLLTAINSVLG